MNQKPFCAYTVELFLLGHKSYYCRGWNGHQTNIIKLISSTWFFMILSNIPENEFIFISNIEKIKNLTDQVEKVSQCTAFLEKLSRAACSAVSGLCGWKEKTLLLLSHCTAFLEKISRAARCFSLCAVHAAACAGGKKNLCSLFYVQLNTLNAAPWKTKIEEKLRVSL